MCRLCLAFGIVLCLPMPVPVLADVSDFDLTAVPAEGTELEQIRRTVESAFAVLRASRDVIRSGHYELTETRIEGAAAAQRIAHVVSENLFERDDDLLRMQFEQDRPLPEPVRFTYIEGPDGACFWDHQGIFTIVNRGYLSTHAYPPVQLASVGLGLFYDHVGRGQIEDGFELMRATLLERGQLISATRSEDGLQIDFFYDEDRLSRFHLLLDETRDCVPRRLESIVYDRAQDVWRNDQQTTTEWTRVDDQWVPQALRSTVTAPRRELELSFRWLSVNQDLPEALFTRASIDLPDGTYIADNTLRANESTLVEVLGESGEALLLADRPTDGGRSFGRTLLIAVNVAVATLILGGLLLRWTVRRRS